MWLVAAALARFSLSFTVGPPPLLLFSQLFAVSLAHFCLAAAHLYPHAPQAPAIYLEDLTLKVVSLFLSHNLINLMISQKMGNEIM